MDGVAVFMPRKEGTRHGLLLEELQGVWQVMICQEPDFGVAINVLDEMLYRRGSAGLSGQLALEEQATVLQCYADTCSLAYPRRLPAHHLLSKMELHEELRMSGYIWTPTSCCTCSQRTPGHRVRAGASTNWSLVPSGGSSGAIAGGTGMAGI